MPRYQSGPGGINLEDGYVREQDLIDQYVGNQLWSFGENTDGVLGDNSITHRSSPVQTIAGGTNWKSIGAGTLNSYGIKTDGTLWAWGYNFNGSLGDGTTVTHRSSPVQVVGNATTWKLVAGGKGGGVAGGQHVAAIKTDGTLWLWGLASEGQLGDGSVLRKSSPVQTIAGGNNWKFVSLGQYHTASVKTDGTLWSWGHNTSGQLGDDSVTHRSSPVQTVSGGTNWKDVSCGIYHTAAIKTDGTLWTWGYNLRGTLGDNTIIHRSSPVQTVAGGTNWKFVSCNGRAVSAIKTDGTLWLWGGNTDGGLAVNDRVHRSSPVQELTGGTNWKFIYGGGSDHFVAIKTDGSLWAWGTNTNGILGDGTQTHRSSPVQTVAGGNNWKMCAAGSYHTIAISFTES